MYVFFLSDATILVNKDVYISRVRVGNRVSTIQGRGEQMSGEIGEYLHPYLYS